MEKMEDEFSLAAIGKELATKALGYVRTAFLTSEQVGILPGKLDFQKDITDSEELIPSAILDCDGGKFIYQVLSVKPAEVIPFEAVKKRVVVDLKKDKALKRVIEIAEECRSKANTIEACLNMLREKLGEKGKTLAIGESNFFTRPRAYGFRGSKHQLNTGIPGDHPLFAEEAFRLNEGKIGFAVEEGNESICYFMALAGRQTADRDTFEKDKRRLIQQYTFEKMSVLQDAWMADLHKRANVERFSF
jgi:hypothetical protein